MLKPAELLRKSLTSESECSRCGATYRGGYRYRGMAVCECCAQTLSAQVKAEP